MSVDDRIGARLVMCRVCGQWVNSAFPHGCATAATARELVKAWCDAFECAMRWLCAPEPTVTITRREYERLCAGYNPGIGLQVMAQRGYR